MEKTDLTKAAMHTVEACADALLTATAMALLADGETPTFERCKSMAIITLEFVIQKTKTEGARP